ncbi:hypothetical protein ABW20_dc0109850 [Dactylellina cionopaga]|nr:hypothetical protein ABW20_dc0109850 [Dactylellina cionopaga]
MAALFDTLNLKALKLDFNGNYLNLGDNILGSVKNLTALDIASGDVTLATTLNRLMWGTRDTLKILNIKLYHQIAPESVENQPRLFNHEGERIEFPKLTSFRWELDGGVTHDKFYDEIDYSKLTHLTFVDKRASQPKEMFKTLVDIYGSSGLAPPLTLKTLWLSSIIRLPEEEEFFLTLPSFPNLSHLGIVTITTLSGEQTWGDRYGETTGKWSEGTIDAESVIEPILRIFLSSQQPHNNPSGASASVMWENRYKLREISLGWAKAYEIASNNPDRINVINNTVGETRYSKLITPDGTVCYRIGDHRALWKKYAYTDHGEDYFGSVWYDWTRAKMW